MKLSLSPWMRRQAAPLSSEPARRRAVDLVLNLAENTPLAPQAYERLLLEQFIRGELTIEEVIVQLELRGHR